MDDASGSSGLPRGTKAAKAAKAAPGTKPATAATKATTKAVTTRTGGARVSTRTTAASAHTASDGKTREPGAHSSAGSGRGRARSRALYNRRVQRANERWPVVARSLAGIFRHPDLVLGLLGAGAPVEREGRVLNRSSQALVETVNRLTGSAGGYDPPAMRDQSRRTARAVMPIRTDVHVSGRVIPGPEGAPDVPIRIYRQYGSGLGAGPGSGNAQQAIVFFHGGGWVTGGLDTHDPLCRILAAVSRCLVVAVDYRLAPEDPFPAAVDDALAAYRWVHRHSGELGIARGQVGVMGDSAGGNLAAVVAQETRSGGKASEPDVPTPLVQGLVYPVADARLDTDSMRDLAEGFLLTRESMEYFRGAYLPDRSDWATAKASPLLAPDLAGLAPALVVTAGFDPLRDDGANYAEALRSAGVDVEYRCYDDQIHGFMVMGVLADALALATEVCDSMGRLMRRSAPEESWA
jgi:acetyl esterase